MTVKQVAERLDATTNWVYSRIKSGELTVEHGANGRKDITERSLREFVSIRRPRFHSKPPVAGRVGRERMAQSTAARAGV